MEKPFYISKTIIALKFCNTVFQSFFIPSPVLFYLSQSNDKHVNNQTQPNYYLRNRSIFLKTMGLIFLEEFQHYDLQCIDWYW